VSGPLAPIGGVPAAGRGADAGDARRTQLREAAQAFEAVFVRQMIGSMRQAKLAEDPFAGRATEQFRDMADARVADDMARTGSFGIADMLIRQFERSGGSQAK
jgi:peptidoglycan hydrolase FlgJ